MRTPEYTPPMSRYTYVQVTVRQKGDVLYFLVPGGEAGADAEMKSYIARQAELQTIDFEKVRAATLDPDSITIRDEAPDGSKTGGDHETRRVGVVDGSEITLPESS